MWVNEEGSPCGVGCMGGVQYEERSSCGMGRRDGVGYGKG